jgi:hypothetical protein
MNENHPGRGKAAAMMTLAALFAAACGGGGGTVTDEQVVNPAPSPSPGPAPAPSPAPGPAPAPSPSPAPAPGPPAPPPVPPPGFGPERGSAVMFFTGHSLLDNPLPDDVAAIARSLGKSVQWNQQNVVGSGLRWRTRGDATTGWVGYTYGKNREGSGMNVINELRSPRTTGGARYDSLIATENHWLVHNLMYEDTVRYLRHYHDRLIDGNAQGTSWFYHAWLTLRDKSNPQSWIAYERAAQPVWQCMASRVNQALAGAGRSDRIVSLPAAGALADLVQRATQGQVAGVSGASVRDTVDRLIKDDVHPTPLAVYYVALVTYASVYRDSPAGAAVPSGVTLTASQALALQNLAWQYVSSYYAGQTTQSNAQCQALMTNSFCSTYWTYFSPSWQTFDRTTEINRCRQHFGQQNSNNPFYGSVPATYWFPPP